MRSFRGLMELPRGRQLRSGRYHSAFPERTRLSATLPPRKQFSHRAGLLQILLIMPRYT